MNHVLAQKEIKQIIQKHGKISYAQAINICDTPVQMEQIMSRLDLQGVPDEGGAIFFQRVPKVTGRRALLRSPVTKGA